MLPCICEKGPARLDFHLLHVYSPQSTKKQKWRSYFADTAGPSALSMRSLSLDRTCRHRGSMIQSSNGLALQQFSSGKQAESSDQRRAVWVAAGWSQRRAPLPIVEQSGSDKSASERAAR